VQLVCYITWLYSFIQLAFHRAGLRYWQLSNYVTQKVLWYCKALLLLEWAPPVSVFSRPPYPQSLHSTPSPSPTRHKPQETSPQHRIAGISLQSAGNSLQNTLHRSELKAVISHTTRDSLLMRNAHHSCLLQRPSSLHTASYYVTILHYLRAAYGNRWKYPTHVTCLFFVYRTTLSVVSITRRRIGDWLVNSKLGRMRKEAGVAWRGTMPAPTRRVWSKSQKKTQRI
jgi:hypothetical protein